MQVVQLRNTGMVMEDTMQNNTVSVQNDEIEIDLFQLIADLWSGLLRNGWLYLALMSIVGTIAFLQPGCPIHHITRHTPPLQ